MSSDLEGCLQPLRLSVNVLVDVRVLAVLSTVCRRLRDDCRAHVRQHLPELLIGALKETEHSDLDEPLVWLYSTAGRVTMGAPATAEAHLYLGPLIAFGLRPVFAQQAVEAGLQPTSGLFVQLAKERVEGLDVWASAIWRQQQQQQQQGQKAPSGIRAQPDHVIPLMVSEVRHRSGLVSMCLISHGTVLSVLHDECGS